VEGPQRRVSFEWAGKGLGDVVSLFAEQSGRDVILAQGVDSVAVTASIRDQEWHLALESVLLAYDLRAVETSSGIILVVPRARAQEARAPESIVLKHRLAGEVEPALRRVLGMEADTVPSGDAVEIIGDPGKSRTLMVHASQDRLAQARSLVAQLDRKPPSVTIEWRQVEVHQDRMQQLGLSYQLGQFRDSLGAVQPGVTVRPTGGLRASAGRAFALLRRSRGGVGALSLEGFVDALAEDGMGETETVQTITVNSDETAEIRVGDAFILPNNQPILAGGGYAPAPFGPQGGGSPQQGSAGAGGSPGQAGLSVGGFQQFETGTSVRATAYVLSADEVRLDLELTRDGGTLAPDGRSITGGKQTASTRVTVKNGTPVVIGGLAVKGRSRTNSGVPGLSRLPVLGRLFRNEGVAEQNRDLLIIVTPRIEVDDDES
jgi:type II secretory pathway component GspD/PulD (secretin)